MTEPRTSRRVARGVLLVLILGLVAVALPIVPAVWEWAVYGEWIGIWKFQTGGFGIISFPPDESRWGSPPMPHVLRDAQPMDSDPYPYFKVKQKRLHWLPGNDLLIRQIGKEEFQGMFPNAFAGSERVFILWVKGRIRNNL